MVRVLTETTFKMKQIVSKPPVESISAADAIIRRGYGYDSKAVIFYYPSNRNTASPAILIHGLEQWGFVYLSAMLRNSFSDMKYSGLTAMNAINNAMADDRALFLCETPEQFIREALCDFR